MKERTQGLRALLIYTALLCLCVSDGVGPRLVPYPDRENARSTRPQAVENSTGRHASITEGEPTPGAGHESAGDTSKKLPVFYASAPSSSQSTGISQLAVSSTRSRRTSSTLSLRHGRAPPLPA